MPIGYIIGGVMVLIGLAGGIYGQMLRRRGRNDRHR
jgi:CheY-specific phosphatase CheX